VPEEKRSIKPDRYKNQEKSEEKIIEEIRRKHSQSLRSCSQLAHKEEKAYDLKNKQSPKSSGGHKSSLRKSHNSRSVSICEEKSRVASPTGFKNFQPMSPYKLATPKTIRSDSSESPIRT
jgi:hypothetical protein